MPDQVTAVRHGISDRKRLVRALMGGAFALAVVLGASLQASAADDQDDESFEEKLFKSLLGNDKPPIDYRERSPLVVPPSTALPPPEQTNAVANPAWPKDADTHAKKKAKVDPRDRVRQRNQEERGLALTPEQLAGRGPGGSGAPSSRQNEDLQTGRALSPTELGSKGSLFGNMFSSKDSTETAPFPGEPARATLTDPPTGYMTPSPNYPYGLSPTKEAPKPLSADDRAVGRQ